MESIINNYNPGGVDSAVLGRSGKGGLLSPGYLVEEPIRAYVGDDERAVFVVSNANSGVEYVCEGSGERTRIRPGDGYRAFAVVTGSRLVFIVGNNQGGREESDYTASVPLADIAVVEEHAGVFTGEFVVVTSSEMRWRFACRDDVGRVVDYLDEASAAWTRVESMLETARMRLVDATGTLESSAYADAMGAIGDAASETESARQRERHFCESGVPAMDARIGRVEDRIDDVRLRVLRGRATHSVDVAETCWREGDYDDAYSAYADAREDYRDAMALLEGDSEARAELRSRLDRVERNITSLEQAPVENARSAERAAEEADSPAQRVRHLERALDRYRTALALDWGREQKRFECDTEAVRDCVDRVAESLVATRESEASHHVGAALEHCEEGRYQEACTAFREAREGLCAARSVARELVPDAVDRVTDRVDAVDDRLAEVERLRRAGAEPPSGQPS